jgi:hypothetical protein
MNDDTDREDRPTRNPFATRYVRPGAINYLFPAEIRVGVLVERLKAGAWWGQIVGPHGSGKSTLLHDLIPHLQAAGRRVELTVMHSDSRCWPGSGRAARAWDEDTQVMIDGYEQLWPWSKWWLRRQCRKRGCGLLITTHSKEHFPEVWVTETSPQLALDLVQRWLTPDEQALLTPETVTEAYQQSGENLRETWFALYDVIEKLRTS